MTAKVSKSTSDPLSTGAPASTGAPDKADAASVAKEAIATLTDVEAINSLSDTATVVVFKPAIKITIDGREFSVTYRRLRKDEPEDWSAPKYVQDVDNYSGTSFKIPYGERLPYGKKFFGKRFHYGKALLSGLSRTGHLFRHNRVIHKIYNDTNKSFGFAYDYLQLSEEEEEKIAKKMEEAWKKYAKEYEETNGIKLDIADVHNIGLGIMFNKKNKPDFKKDWSFYVFVKEKDKDGNVKTKKNGEIKYKLIWLFTGKASSGDALGAVATALPDLSTEKRTTYKTFEEYCRAKDAGFEEPTATSEVSNEENTEQQIDANICYLHAILNFLKGLKPKAEQKAEFAKKKGAMDRESMALKRKLKIEDSNQKDAHEILVAHPSITQNPERFSTTTTKYYRNPSWFASWFSPTTAREEELSRAPLPMLAITDKRDLQASLDHHHYNTDIGGEYEGHPYTLEHTLYTTKPPFLMLGIKRYSSSGGEERKIDTPITAPDMLKLKAGTHISQMATEGHDSEYALKGFIYHAGDKTISGHYVTYMIDPDGSWRKFDNMDEDSYGKKVEQTDAELADRRKKAYLYLYIDDADTKAVPSSPDRTSKSARARLIPEERQAEQEQAADELFPL